MRPEIAQVIQFFSALLITIIGFIINQIFQKKPKLITFYAHTSEIILKNQDGTDFVSNINTKVGVRSHTVVIGNIGKATANNVKVIHGILPINYTIYPPIHYVKHDNEITIPTLAPGENVAITYLYFQDIHFSQTTLLVKCDECLAIAGNMKHVYDYPTWVIAALYFFLFVGVVTTVYLAIDVVLCFYHSCAGKCWL